MAKRILMGIGNELKGDDAVGHLIARGFRAEGWLSIACGTVPEGFTSVIRRERPELVVIVDAADFGGFPGEFRILPKEKLGSDSSGTHGMPLMHLVEYLEELSGRVVFIGIQPRSMQLGDRMSPAVAAAMKSVTELLLSGELERFSGESP